MAQTCSWEHSRRVTLERISEGLLNLRTFSSFWVYRRTGWTVSCWRILTCTVSCLPFSHQFFKSDVPKCVCHKDGGTKWSSCTFHIFCEIFLNGVFSLESRSKYGGFKAALDFTSSRIHIYHNGSFPILISMILRSVYNAFSTKFLYFYEKDIQAFRDLGKKKKNIKTYNQYEFNINI